MGREIGLVFALAGCAVLLTDQSQAALDAAMARLSEILAKGVARGFYTPDQRDGALANLDVAVGVERLADCDYVTEAVFESEDVKAGVYGKLAAVLAPSCIIATNTSTIPISVLASHLGPERRPFFIGTHFFSPVSRMALVEVISGIETSPATLEATLELCRSIGKTPVPIRDVPGFAVNRLLHVFLIEAVRLVEEGVATPEDLDLACRLGLGHPMGPFELMDATTSSLCLQAQEIMHEAYGERFRPRPLLKQRVRAGMVGGRGKRGWRTRAAGS